MQTIETLTELLRMAHEQIETEVAKNAELEKDLSNAQTMGDKEQSIRDLEQRAKGVVNGYVSGCKWALGAQYNEEVVKNRAIIYSKALKEQGR